MIRRKKTQPFWGWSEHEGTLSQDGLVVSLREGSDELLWERREAEDPGE